MYYNNETRENCMKNRRPSASLPAGAAVLGLLLLVPIARIMRDAVPFSDDYGYGIRELSFHHSLAMWYDKDSVTLMSED